MKITIITVGKLKEKFWIEACNEYIKRLQAYVKLNIIEISDSNNEEESKLILKKINRNSFIIALCIEGNQLDSIELSKFIEKKTIDGISHATFIVGGSTGLSQEIKSIADYKLSFGKITLPHNLARVVLLEQIYRSFKIINRETYHK